MPTPNYGFNTPPQTTRISSIPYEIGLLAEQIDAAILSLSAGAGTGTYPAPAQITDTANLNFLTAPGKWARYTTPPATWAGQNYPAQVRGFLEVYATTPGLTVAGRSMAQMYVSAVDTYTAPRVWVRTGTVPTAGTYAWGAWREVTTTENQMPVAAYDMRGNMTNGALTEATQLLATPTFIPAKSDLDIFTRTAGELKATQAGTYAIDCRLQLWNDSTMAGIRAVTARSFVDVVVAGVATRVAIPLSEDQTSVAVTNIRLGVNDTVRFRLHQVSGSTAYYTAEARIIKLK